MRKDDRRDDAVNMLRHLERRIAEQGVCRPLLGAEYAGDAEYVRRYQAAILEQLGSALELLTGGHAHCKPTSLTKTGE